MGEQGPLYSGADRKRGQLPGRHRRILHYLCFVLLRYETATMWLNGGGGSALGLRRLSVLQLMGHLPALIHPDLRDILVIGFGGAMA